jgi:hypothetical protein
VPREFGTLGTHPTLQLGDQRDAALLAHRQAFGRRLAVNAPLDLEQRIDPPHRGQRHRRDEGGRPALRAAFGVTRDIGQFEEFSSPVSPTRRLDDRARGSGRHVQFVVAAISIGLEYPAVVGEMGLRVNAGAIARVIEHRAGWARSTKRSIVAHVNPDAGDIGLTLRHHRHGGVIAVDPTAGEHHGFDEGIHRLQRNAGGADQIGQGRDAERDTLQAEPFGLAVQRLMEAKLVVGDHREQAGAGEGARNGVERCGFLADFLAVAAGEFLPHMLDYLERARSGFQRLGDTLPELGQARATAAEALGWPGQDDPLAG